MIDSINVRGKFIAIDMDGVLCDFIEGAMNLQGLMLEDFCRAAAHREKITGIKPGFELLVDMCCGEKKLWDAIEEAGESFWLDLLPTPALEFLCHAVEELVKRDLVKEFFVVSCPGRGPHGVYDGKRKWLRKHCGQQWADNLILCPSDLKVRFVANGCWLVDDKQETCEAWRTAGGKALQWPCPPGYASYPEAREAENLFQGVMMDLWGV